MPPITASCVPLQLPSRAACSATPPLSASTAPADTTYIPPLVTFVPPLSQAAPSAPIFRPASTAQVGIS